MTRDEIVLTIQHRFGDSEDEWSHSENRDIYLVLFERLEAAIGMDGALDILMHAFWAAADEYGA